MGDYWREAINRGAAFIRGLFCFRVKVEYSNPVTFELPRGLCYGEERSSWLANRWWFCYYLSDWKVKALNVTDSLEFESFVIRNRASLSFRLPSKTLEP